MVGENPRLCRASVSMPLRAFLLFGPNYKGDKNVSGCDSFNALAGIFAFRTRAACRVRPRGFCLFQCPCGHFCFSDPGERLPPMWAARRVSMPLRAFLLFGQIVAGRNDVGGYQFQCPCGHFCFSDRQWSSGGRREHHLPVSMPLRAFLLFGQKFFSPMLEHLLNTSVSMPLRAFLLFGRTIRKWASRNGYGFQCPCGHFCFSDIDALLLQAAAERIVSMPLRAFLLFGL